MAGAFELQIRKFAEKAKDNADLVVRKVLLDVYDELILRSPVGTGRFRANWIYSEMSPARGTVAVSGTTASPSSAPESPDVSAAGMGQVHFITNNLPYAYRLETGHSKQAPSGMVGLTVLKFNDFMRNAVAEVAG